MIPGKDNKIIKTDAYILLNLNVCLAKSKPFNCFLVIQLYFCLLIPGSQPADCDKTKYEIMELNSLLERAAKFEFLSVGEGIFLYQPAPLAELMFVADELRKK